MSAAVMQASAQVQGTIIKKDRGSMSGVIKYDPQRQSYSVIAAGAGSVSFDVPRENVLDIDIPRPKQLDQAAAAVQRGQADPAVIQTLEQIVRVYTMLKWDVPAARWLAEAQLKQGNVAAAMDMCDRVLRANPSAAYSADFSKVYWDCLLAKGLTQKLENELSVAVQRGDRELAAVAQMKRGDIQQKEGRFKEALVDGYLRTVILFKDVKTVQGEALFKAAKCFEQLGQNANADKMRRRLLAEFPSDPYAGEMKQGT
jgi:tetratricopeptide (TPR) repeat protein